MIFVTTKKGREALFLSLSFVAVFGSEIQGRGWKKLGSGINIPDPRHWLFIPYLNFCHLTLVISVFGLITLVSELDPDPHWPKVPILDPRWQHYKKVSIPVLVGSYPVPATSVPDPGSGAFFYPWTRDPGWVKNQDPDPGWTTRIMFPRA